jgi:hypothetical protein
MPALPPPLLLTLVLCAIVVMAVIGTVHADSPAKLQYWEQMKAMMQAADGASLGDSQSRAAAVVSFVVDVDAGFRSGQSWPSRDRARRSGPLLRCAPAAHLPITATGLSCSGLVSRSTSALLFEGRAVVRLKGARILRVRRRRGLLGRRTWAQEHAACA